MLYVRSDVDKYHQRLTLYIERFTADFNDGLGVLLYSLSTEVKKLVRKQRKDIGTYLKTDVEGFDAFLQSVGSKLRRPRLFS